MAKFYPLSVSDVRKETEHCISVAFEIPDALKKKFSFLMGQYITLKIKINGEELKRTYSISSSPVLEQEIRIAFKRVKNGKVSNYLFESLKKGDMVEVMAPMGNFHSNINPSDPKNYLLFATGSGITPIFSILKTVLFSGPGSKVFLIYSNRDESSIIFKRKLEELQEQYQGRLKVLHLLKNPSGLHEAELTGVLTTEKTEELLKKNTDIRSFHEFFICGPSGLMQNVKTVLEKLSVPGESIHLEYFSAVLQDISEAEKRNPANQPDIVLSKVSVILDGKQTDFELNSNGEPILDAVLAQGLDAPYACKSGICSTCMAKILEGKVGMEKSTALTDSEVSEGFILTCQSHPLSEKVVITYD